MAKTILVPTDFSSNALMAAHYALRLAGELSCNVHILHAHYPLNRAFRTRPRDKKEEEQGEAMALAELQRFVETLGGVQHGQITHSLTTTNLVESVQEHIADNSIAFVVMGTHGTSDTNRNVLGSSTYDVAKSIHIPVLVVPENTAAVKLDKVVLFTNYHNGDVDTLNGLHSLLTDPSKTTCTIVHILGGDPLEKGAEQQRIGAWKEKLIKETGFVNFDTKLVAGKGDVAVVDEIIDSLDADLTLLTYVDRVGFFDRLFHKSLAKAIILNPKTPILLVTEF